MSKYQYPSSSNLPKMPCFFRGRKCIFRKGSICNDLRIGNAHIRVRLPCEWWQTYDKSGFSYKQIPDSLGTKKRKIYSQIHQVTHHHLKLQPQKYS